MGLLFFRGLPNTIYLFNIWFDLSSLSCVEFLYVAGSILELLFCCIYVYRVLGIVCISNGVISDSTNSFIELIKKKKKNNFFSSYSCLLLHIFPYEF